jgi:hypothetical protein
VPARSPHALHVIEEDRLDHDTFARRDPAAERGEDGHFGAMRILQDARLEYAAPRAAPGVAHLAPSLRSNDQQRQREEDRRDDQDRGNEDDLHQADLGASSLRTRARNSRALKGFTT